VVVEPVVATRFVVALAAVAGAKASVVAPPVEARVVDVAAEAGADDAKATATVVVAKAVVVAV